MSDSRISRREFAASLTAALAAAPGMPAAGLARALRQDRPRPTAAQLAWQREELALFVHFGVNTFTDREWGDGREDPAMFSPGRLDARQWARTARDAGFRAMILTAKHHDGFCLWPTRTTRHSVASSPWRGGQGDLVLEFVDACRAFGLRAGLYLSPWDRNAPVYGDSPRYNDFYVAQLTELLTGYGRLAEVWFDGANGEGPNGRRQEYDWPRFFGTVRRLQPDAVMFSDAGPDVRWIGNERGQAGDPNWSTVRPEVVPYPGIWNDAVREALQHGHRDGPVWRPGETDTSIRPGWFYHPAGNERVKSVGELERIYFQSVGRNSKLLLNVPPTPDGLLHDVDAGRLMALRARLDARFRDDVARGRRIRWRPSGPAAATAEVDLGRPVTTSLVRLEEDIAHGQAVARYTILGQADGGDWRELAHGQTIGYRKLDRFEAATVRRIRVRIDEAAAPARPLRLGVYAGA